MEKDAACAGLEIDPAGYQKVIIQYQSARNLSLTRRCKWEIYYFWKSNGFNLELGGNSEQ